jgi:hypothetical protein
MVETWILQTARHHCLSEHPNESGAKLSALFHVKKGDKIYWEDRYLPKEIGAFIGVVNGKDKFVIIRRKTDDGQETKR